MPDTLARPEGAQLLVERLRSTSSNPAIHGIEAFTKWVISQEDARAPGEAVNVEEMRY